MPNADAGFVLSPKQPVHDEESPAKKPIQKEEETKSKTKMTTTRPVPRYQIVDYWTNNKDLRIKAIDLTYVLDNDAETVWYPLKVLPIVDSAGKPAPAKDGKPPVSMKCRGKKCGGNSSSKTNRELFLTRQDGKVDKNKWSFLQKIKTFDRAQEPSQNINIRTSAPTPAPWKAPKNTGKVPVKIIPSKQEEDSKNTGSVPMKVVPTEEVAPSQEGMKIQLGGPSFSEPVAGKVVTLSGNLGEGVVPTKDTGYVDIKHVETGVATRSPMKIDEKGNFQASIENLATGDHEWTATANIDGEEVSSVTYKFTNEGEVVKKSSLQLDEIEGEGGSTPYNGDAKDATGKLYFEQFDEDEDEWFQYYCSASAIHDNKTGRSLILTAAHCIFDSFNEMFHRNPLFIPNEKANSDHDLNCSDDPCGCWVPTGGVVHEEWKSAGSFPANQEYDIGFYIVEDSPLTHEGNKCHDSTTLDVAVDELFLDIKSPVTEGDTVTAIGYHTNNDSFGMESCTGALEKVTLDGKDSLLVPDCGLASGASGGPWIHDDKVVGVNSWGYKEKEGMGGPILQASPTRCLVNKARSVEFSDLVDSTDAAAGVFANCYERPCIEANEKRRLRGTNYHQLRC